MQVTADNNDVKEYLRDIKTLLPLKGAPERHFVKELGAGVYNFIENNKDI